MGFGANITTCHGCRHACPPPRSGACPCALDGRDIVEHAMSGQCPAGRFGGGAPATSSAAATADRAEARAVIHLPICRACPFFRGRQPNGLYVNCAGAKNCCGPVVGEVSLGYGSCPRCLWPPDPAPAEAPAGGVSEGSLNDV